MDASNPAKKVISSINSQEGHIMNKKTTSKGASKSASKTLTSNSTGKSSKSASGSALSQTGTPKRQTSPKAASAASKTLSDGRTRKASKSAAGSTLAQTPKKKGKWFQFLNRFSLTPSESDELCANSQPNRDGAMKLSSKDHVRVCGLIEFCKKYQGEYVPGDHGPGS